MNITLTTEQEELVQSQLQPADYSSLEEFSQAAIALIAERDSLQKIAEEPEYRNEISYNPIPPKRSFTVKARVRFTGRAQPRPYDLSDN